MKKLFVILCLVLCAGVITSDLLARGGRGGGGRGGRGRGGGGRHYSRRGGRGRGGGSRHYSRRGGHGGRGGSGFAAGVLTGALLTPIIWNGGYINDVYYDSTAIVCVDENGNRYPCSVNADGNYVPLITVIDS